MHEAKIFLKRRRVSRWIKAKNSKKLGRPVVESSRVERPAAHVRQALAFVEIERVSMQRFIGAFALLDVHAGAVPLDDRAVRVPQRNLAVKHPAIFAVRLANPSFELEDFTGRQAGAPLRHDSVQIFGMDKISPIPAADLIQGDAEIFEPASVEVVEMAVGPRGVDQGGDRIDEKLDIQRLRYRGHGRHYNPVASLRFRLVAAFETIAGIRFLQRNARSITGACPPLSNC